MKKYINGLFGKIGKIGQNTNYTFFHPLQRRNPKEYLSFEKEGKILVLFITPKKNI
ncbi:hypothetical protein [Brachyspira aalborgi]|uniref:hypothetical protein n=1 Tax=Brachyspira aalborgi TaxID=29522 RepID=UPI002665DF5D|nr:hypothetical protein [Brachyspira aalborgi]